MEKSTLPRWCKVGILLYFFSVVVLIGLIVSNMIQFTEYQKKKEGEILSLQEKIISLQEKHMNFQVKYMNLLIEKKEK